VVLAFLVTVCLSGVVIILLYFRRGLRPRLYDNEIDQAITGHLRSNNATKEPLNVALRNFLFVLSDQQLATGVSLALVVYIRFAKADEFSIYSFQMATSTIFMSCLTHLSTLAALPDKFSAVDDDNDGHGLYGACEEDSPRRKVMKKKKKKKKKKKWIGIGAIPRLIIMMALAFLLMPILVISSLPSFAVDPSLSFKCARDKFSSYSGLANVFAIAAAGIITFRVITGYFGRIRKVLGPPPHRNKNPSNSFQSRLQELRTSFLWELISLTFYYTFGITNLVVTWKTLAPLKQWSLSFGQLLPAALLLFALPLVYADYLKGKLLVKM
jgi:hypothetical protein